MKGQTYGWAVACLASGLLLFSPAHAADQMPWCSDFRTACGLAAEQHRLVLVHFTKDDCPPCRKVEAEVFTQPQVGEAAGQNFIPVLAPLAKSQELAMRYQITRFPTDLFLTPSGLEVYRAVSPQKPAEYIALLNQVAMQTGTSSPRSWAATMGQAAQKAANSTAAKVQQTSTTAKNAAGQLAAGTQQQAAVGQQSWAQAVEQFHADGAQARAAAKEAADGVDRAGHQIQQQVVGAADELHERTTVAANSAEQKVAEGVDQFRQQSAAAAQQVQQQAKEMTQPWQAAAQKTADAAKTAGQQVAGAAQGAAQSWQQSLGAMQTDLRSGFNPGGAPPTAMPTNPTPPAANSPEAANSLPASPPPSSAPVAAAAPPTTVPAPSPIVSQQPLLPTENPWFSANRAVAPTTKPAATPPSPPAMTPPAASPPLLTSAAPPLPVNAAPNMTSPVASAPPAAPALPAMQSPAESRQSVAASQAPPVALNGFCVVSLMDSMAWKKADPKYGAIHRGRTYLFVSENAQRKFLANPDGFAPVLSGCDPVRFARTGELVEGKREYGLVTPGPDKRIFLFADEQALKVFESNPGEFAEAARQAMLRSATGRTFR